MNSLDIRTVLFNQVITYAICAMVMAYMWKFNNNKSAGLGFWLINFIMQLLAVLLIVIRESIPAIFSIVIANILVIAGTLFLLIGLGKYTGKQSHQVHNYILLAIFTLIHGYFTYSQNNLQARNINASIGLLLLCIQLAWLLLRRVEPDFRKYTQPVGIVFVVYSVIIFIRIILTILLPPTNDFFQSGLADTIILMTYQMLFIGLTFSLLLMVNRRQFISLENEISEHAKATDQMRSMARFPEENPNPIFRIDIQGRIIFANTSGKSILHRWTREDQDYIPAAWFIPIQNILKHSRTTEIIEKISSQVFSFYLSTAPDGQTINVYGRDVTAKITATHELEAERNKLRGILDRMKDSVFIINADDDIEYSNPSGQNEFGKDTNQKCYQYFYDQVSHCDWCNNKEVFDGNTSQWDWHSIERNKHFSIFETPITNSAGSVSRLEIIQDITQQKQNEHDLRENLGRFKAIFDQAAVGVAQLNSITGQFIIANQKYCEITGLDPEKIQQATYKDVTYPEDIQENIDLINKMISGEIGSFSIEKRYLHQDGRVVWAALTASPMWNPAEPPDFHIAVIQDITKRKQFEEKLLASEERFRNTITLAPFPAMIHSEDGNVELINEEWQRVTGYSIDEINTIEDWTEKAYGTRKGSVQEDIDKLYGITGRIDEGEYSITTKSGNQRVWHFSSTPLGKTSDSQRRVMSMANDVTEQIQVEMELFEAKEYAERLIETANVMIIVMDHEGNVTLFNDAAEQITGYTRDEISGRNWFEIIVPKDSYPNVWEEFKRLTEGGLPQNFENPILTKSGEEKIISWKNKDIHDAERITGTLSFGIDITESKRAEEALMESEKRYRMLHDILQDASVVTDMDGHILEFNRAYQEMIGYETDELYKLTYFDLTPEKWHQMENNIVLEQIFRRGYSDVYEKEYIKKDGTIFPVNLRTHLMKNEKGEKIGMWAMIRDISERKKAELEIHRLNENLEVMVEERTRQLQAAMNELEAFSYSVSHDLRAPLRAMDGFSLAVMDDYKDKLGEAGLDYLNRIREASHKMANLIDAMLNLTRVTRSELNPTTVNISEMAEEIAAELSASNRKRKVLWKIAPNMQFLADKVLLRIAFENLMENAWKFTSKHPTGIVEVGWNSQNGRTIFFVKDDGAGFDMQFASKMFTAFQRMHSSDEFIGTGIGLATVARIINKHGGKIWAEGQPDDGAIFYFTLEQTKEKNDA